MTVGERIKLIRNTKNISQTELALAINVSKQNLYKYENNIITNIPSDKIEAIAEFLKISPAYIMGWENDFKVTDTPLTSHENKVIVAYRNKPDMQPAVDRLLGIDDEEYVPVAVAARSKDNRPVEIKYISKEKLEEIRNAPSVEDEVDL